MYYIDEGQWFKDNLQEINRVIKPGGYLLATLPHPRTFILKGALEISDSHFRITNDPYGLRNGIIFKVFHDKKHILDEFGQDYEDLSIGETHDNYYGSNISLWLVVGRKKL
jgi:SAM-dependent methyltransferase